MTVCVGLFLYFQFFHQAYFSRCCSAWLMADWEESRRSLTGRYSTPSFALFDSKKLVSWDRFLIFSIGMVNPTLGQKSSGLFSFPPNFSSIIWASGGLTISFIFKVHLIYNRPGDKMAKQNSLRYPYHTLPVSESRIRHSQVSCFILLLHKALVVQK